MYYICIEFPEETEKNGKRREQGGQQATAKWSKGWRIP